MSLSSILGDLPRERFVADHLHKLPLARAGGARELCLLGTWETLARILPQPGADVMVVRNNQQFAGELPNSAAAAEALVAAGHTLLVRHAERHDERLAALAAGFAEELAGPVDVHLYCTPPGQHGFGWHYDAEEVFILQTAGSKDYQLRKNTVNPWPLAETLPANMPYEREIMPLFRCRLDAGDWLYIPSGYWHRAAAVEGLAISLAVGVLPATAVDIFDLLRPDVLDSLLWRQRLPLVGRDGAVSDEQRQQFRELLAQLSADLARQLAQPALLERLLAALGERGRGGPSLPPPPEPIS